MAKPRRKETKPRATKAIEGLHIDLDSLIRHDEGEPLTAAEILQLQGVEAARAHVGTLKGKRGQEDFWYFVHHIWGPRHPGYMKLIDDCHKRMARHFQDMILEWEWVREQVDKGAIEGYIVRYAQEAARGFGKSLLWTVAGSSWVQVRNPDASLVIDTRTEPLGIAFLQPISNVLKGIDKTSDFVEHYGTWFSQKRLWDKTQIIHAKRRNMAQIEPSWDLSAVNISQTSRHPDGVLTDDPINETDGEAEIAQALIHHKSWPNIIRVPGFHGLSGTPYVKGDVISYAKERESGTDRGAWQWISVPALIRDASGNEVSQAPKIRPTGWLLKKREEDPVNFASQFMLRPGEGEHQPLTLAQLVELELNGADMPTAGFTSIHADCAWTDGRKHAKGDWTGYAIVWNTAHFSTVVDLWGKPRAKQEDYFSALTLAVKALGTGPREPLVITMDADTGGYGGAAKRLHEIEFASRGLWLPRVISINRQSQENKTKRIYMAAGQIARGRVRFLRGLKHRDELFFQLTHVGSSGHDDLAEIVSDIFHPEISRLMVFGARSRMFGADEGRQVAQSGGETPAPLPSQIASGLNLGATHQVVPTNRHPLDGPHHDPAFIEDVLRELSEEKWWH